MSRLFDTIDRGLAESQQNVINLTEPDYEVYPLFVQMDTIVALQIDLTIQSQALTEDIFILGDIDKGILGVSKLGGPTFSWVDEQELVNV